MRKILTPFTVAFFGTMMKYFHKLSQSSPQLSPKMFVRLTAHIKHPWGCFSLLQSSTSKTVFFFWKKVRVIFRTLSPVFNRKLKRSLSHARYITSITQWSKMGKRPTLQTLSCKKHHFLVKLSSHFNLQSNIARPLENSFSSCNPTNYSRVERAHFCDPNRHRGHSSDSQKQTEKFRFLRNRLI